MCSPSPQEPQPEFYEADRGEADIQEPQAFVEEAVSRIAATLRRDDLLQGGGHTETDTASLLRARELVRPLTDLITALSNERDAELLRATRESNRADLAVTAAAEANAKFKSIQSELSAIKQENERLRAILVEAHNTWRHEFDDEVDKAATKLFKRLSHVNTGPCNRAALHPSEPPCQ